MQATNPLPLNYPSRDLLEGKREFDIRRVHSYDLIMPKKKLMPSLNPKINERATA